MVKNAYIQFQRGIAKEDHEVMPGRIIVVAKVTNAAGPSPN